MYTHTPLRSAEKRKKEKETKRNLRILKERKEKKEKEKERKKRKEKERKKEIGERERTEINELSETVCVQRKKKLTRDDLPRTSGSDSESLNLHGRRRRLAVLQMVGGAAAQVGEEQHGVGPRHAFVLVALYVVARVVVRKHERIDVLLASAPRR